MHQWPNPNHRDRGWKWHHSLWFGMHQWWHYTTIAFDLMAQSKSCLKAEDKIEVGCNERWGMVVGGQLLCLLDEVKLILFCPLGKKNSSNNWVDWKLRINAVEFVTFPHMTMRVCVCMRTWGHVCVVFSQRYVDSLDVFHMHLCTLILVMNIFFLLRKFGFCKYCKE